MNNRSFLRFDFAYKHRHICSKKKGENENIEILVNKVFLYIRTT